MDRYAAEKIRSFGTSVFAEMSRLAVQHQAVNLGQGFPDFAGPDFVKEAAKRAIDADLNQYAVSHGHPRLRKAIAADLGPRFELDIDPDAQVTVATGATEVIFDAMQAFIGPGDEVVAFEPFYDSYPTSTRWPAAPSGRSGCTRRTGRSIPTSCARRSRTRTRVLLLNTPHNPTGKVFTRDELELIAALAQEHDLVVLTDEVYDRILFTAHAISRSRRCPACGSAR